MNRAAMEAVNDSLVRVKSFHELGDDLWDLFHSMEKTGTSDRFKSTGDSLC